MDSSPPPPPAHQRHWPLDLPSGLPFERYEHRRLAARDILVHRIMTAVFAPAARHQAAPPHDSQASSLLSAALAAPRQPPSRIEMARAYDPRVKGPSSRVFHTTAYHNFSGLKAVDRALARDVEVLRKMLVTRSAGEWVQQYQVKPPKPVAPLPGSRILPPVTTWSWVREEAPGPSRESRPPVEEEVLDLVRMHFLEMDDPVTRLWLGMVDAPRRSGYKTVPKMTMKADSHKALVQKRRAWHERNEAEDYKRWYPEETAHLKALQSQTHAANERPLYEGGAFLPRLRQKVLASRVARAKYLNNMMEVEDQSYFTDEHDGYEIQNEVYPWPEPEAPRRVLHAPSVFSWRQKQHFFRAEMPPVDFASARTGRGLDRDGIWSTGRWYGDDVPRGRTSRRGRRRAASEPPPGTFTSARLPISFNSTRELLIFPKMSLSTIERRVRRRSLSRTRIAEMFTWDLTLENSHPKPPVRLDCIELFASPPKDQLNRLSYVDEMQRPMPYWDNYNARWVGLYNKFKQNRLSIHDAIEAAWVAVGHTSPCDYLFPQLMVNLDGGQYLELRQERTENGGIQLSLYLHSSRPPSLEAPAAPCANCVSKHHKTEKCRLPCGHCGAPNPNMDYKHVDVGRNIYRYPSLDDDNDAPKAGKHDNPHLAPNCPLAPQNRCKCSPFPNFHPAAKCPMLCSRPCGNTAHPPGHFKHKNAMGCKSRCCMCGTRGHSGMKCKLKRCRCGGAHLGQDCAWHPACRVGGCDRFHCGVHCRSCGLDRHEAGVVLLEGLCPACKASDSDKSSSPAEAVDRKGKGKRRNKRSSRSDPRKPKPEKTWYAPLEARTRPVVGVKSGKSAAKRDGIDGEAQVRIGGCR